MVCGKLYKCGILLIRGLCESQDRSEIFRNKENASAGIRTPGHEARSIDAVLHSLPRVFLNEISLTKCHRRNVLNVFSQQITKVPKNMCDVTENQKGVFPYRELWLITFEKSYFLLYYYRLGGRQNASRLWLYEEGIRLKMVN